MKPASWHQAQENMNGRCNLSQLNALFAEGKTHIPWAQNWDHAFGSWAANFSIVAPFLGPESGPCFGATKHKQELVNTGSKCATADASWQQHIPVILYEHIERHTLGTHGTTTTYHTLHPTSHWIRYVRCLFDSWFGQLPAPSSRKTGTLNFWRPSNNSASELLIYSILLVWNINWAIFFAWTLWCPQTWVENSSSVYMGMGQKPGT